MKNFLPVALVFLAVLFFGCAGHKVPVAVELEGGEVEILEETSLPKEVIVFQETDVSGFTVEYGVLRCRSAGEKSFFLEYLDPEEETILDEKDVMIYFKLDVYNPTGKLLEIIYELDMDSGESVARESRYFGGNVPNGTFYFYVPIQAVEKGTKFAAGLKVFLKDAETFMETEKYFFFK